LYDRYFEGLDIPYVATDNYTGAYSATEELIKGEELQSTQIFLNPEIIRDSIRTL